MSTNQGVSVLYVLPEITKHQAYIFWEGWEENLKLNLGSGNPPASSGRPNKKKHIGQIFMTLLGHVFFFPKNNK